MKTLPEKLALKVLSHVPGKDLLVACGVRLLQMDDG